MRPCNSSVVGDPRSLINDFHSIIFAPSGALPHKGRARRVHRVAQSDPQTANSAGVTLSHRSQPCYGPGGAYGDISLRGAAVCIPMPASALLIPGLTIATT